jgi:hypothetical protein
MSDLPVEIEKIPPSSIEGSAIKELAALAAVPVAWPLTFSESC